MKTTLSQLTIAVLVAMVSSTAHSVPDSPTLLHQGEALEHNRRESLKALDALIRPEPNAQLSLPETSSQTPARLMEGEIPCFPIQQVVLDGTEAKRFQDIFDSIVDQSGFQSGFCLGTQGISALMERFQNALYVRGYSTTRVLVENQNLRSGTLTLTVVPGRIRHIVYDTTNADETHVRRIMGWGNQFPLREGDILNLHVLEQGLENLRRNPTVSAELRIEPADSPNESDVVVVWRQRLVPWRLAVSVDDAGNRATGRYQGSVTVAGDNPFGLSDLFYLNVSRAIGHRPKVVGEDGAQVKSGTTGIVVHYSVPFGNWLYAVTHQQFSYHQGVQGFSDIYDYSGRSRTSTLEVSRLLYRDAVRKTFGSFKLWTRESENFIDGVPLDVQHRRTTGWALALSHEEHLGRAVLDARLEYKRGTGALQSLSSPGEDFDEGTSRMKVLMFDLAASIPFELIGENFLFQSTVHWQHNFTPLDVPEQLAIGGRYTVRGFDGDVTLMAEHGGYWQNTFAWNFLDQHQLYVGLDAGCIGGPMADYQLGRTLVGSVFGVRGRTDLLGSLYYDVFVGKPLKKPDYFQTAQYAVGFSLNWTF